MRYFFELTYKGTNYHGWQIQQNAISIQQVVQEKLKQLIKDNVEITGSGRTDTGVHARQQFFHVDLGREIDVQDFKYHFNAVLPKDILVRSIRRVKNEAHARFDATSREYSYLIIPQKDPFKLNEAYIYPRPVDVNKLNTAAKNIIGKHDFRSFSKSNTQVNDFFCRVNSATWQQEGEGLVFSIEANRFLRGMVRAIVGTLLEINEDKIDLNSIHKILDSKNRGSAGRSVPADGLYLSKVNYPTHIFED